MRSLALGLAFAACGGTTANLPDASLDVAVCDPAAGPFSLAIDNPFFPMPVGHQLILDGADGGATVHLEITVLDQTEVVAGVTTRVLEERELEDGALIEVSRNFFAQAPDGTVCYFGEDVDIYQGGAIVGHEGAWRAGVGDNRPGIIMPAAPALGDSYAQEVAPGIAEDSAEVVAVGGTLTVAAGTFTDTIETREWSPLEPGQYSRKVYVRGIGMAVDATVELTSYQ